MGRRVGQRRERGLELRDVDGVLCVEFINYGNEMGEKWARNICRFVKLREGALQWA